MKYFFLALLLIVFNSHGDECEDIKILNHIGGEEVNCLTQDEIVISAINGRDISYETVEVAFLEISSEGSITRSGLDKLESFVDSILRRNESEDCAGTGGNVMGTGGNVIGTGGNVIDDSQAGTGGNVCDDSEGIKLPTLRLPSMGRSGKPKRRGSFRPGLR